jgi:hypothetical protein
MTVNSAISARVACCLLVIGGVARDFTWPKDLATLAP